MLAAWLLATTGSPFRAHAQPPGARPVEQGVGDVGPLSTGSRILPRDLRLPRGFDRVYEIPRTNALGITEQTLIRIDGAVTAVFPQSVYKTIGPGVSIAEIPPGTIFYVGDLPPGFGPPQPVRRPNVLSIDLSTDLSARAPADPSETRTAEGLPATITADPPSLWTHEEFRRQRLDQMLRGAYATPGRRAP